MPRASASLSLALFAMWGCTFDFDRVGPGATGGNGGTSPDGGAGAGDQGGDPSSGASGAGGDGQGGAIPTDCDEGRCIAIPAGFEGPVRLAQEERACGGSLAFEAGYAGANPTIAPPAECGCKCGLPAAVACGSHQVSGYQTATCLSGGVDYEFTVSQGGCQASPGVSSLRAASAGGSPAGQCLSDNMPAMREDWTFTAPVFACDEALGVCIGSEDTCIPPKGQYCVYSPEIGAECPMEDFTERFEIFRREDMTDNRTCICNCGLVAGECLPRYELFGAASCVGQVAQDELSGCVSRGDNQSFPSFRYAPILDPLSASCPTAEELHAGGVVGSPTVLCCTPLE